MRCPECRTTRKFYVAYQAHLASSGHSLCNCGGYHFKHRPGSTYCERNPLSGAYLASRYGCTDAEFNAIVERIRGTQD